MRVALADLAAGTVDLELPGDGTLRRVRLDGVTGAGGTVASGPGGTSLRPVTAGEVTVGLIEWPFGGGELALASPAVLGGVACEAELADDGSGFHGRATAATLAGRRFGLRLGADRFVSDVRAVELAVEQSSARGHAAAAGVELGDLEATLGGLIVRGGRAALEGVRCDWGKGGTLVSIGRALLDGVALRGGGLALEAASAALPSGLLTSGGAIVVPSLELPQLTLTTADLAALLAGGEPAADGAEAAPGARGPLDLGFLDRVAGQLDVDLTAEISLPVVGGRRATHRFRVPISEGTFNYKDLENDLARIEDAFIDVEVRGKTLAIERRIPLVPGSEKPLLLFDLDDAELELARRRRARLATLATMRRPPGADDGGGDRSSAIALVRLDFAIDLALTMAAPVDPRPDLAWRLGVERARASGALRFAPGKTLEPTRGAAGFEGVTAGPAQVRIGDLAIGFQRVRIGTLEIDLEFDGFAPRAVRAVARDVAIEHLRIAPA